MIFTFSASSPWCLHPDACAAAPVWGSLLSEPPFVADRHRSGRHI